MNDVTQCDLISMDHIHKQYSTKPPEYAIAMIKCTTTVPVGGFSIDLSCDLVLEFNFISVFFRVPFIVV